MQIIIKTIVMLMIGFSLHASNPSLDAFKDFALGEMKQSIPELDIRPSAPSDEIERLAAGILETVLTSFLADSTSGKDYFFFSIYALDMQLARNFGLNVPDMKVLGLAGRFFPLSTEGAEVRQTSTQANSALPSVGKDPEVPPQDRELIIQRLQTLSEDALNPPLELQIQSLRVIDRYAFVRAYPYRPGGRELDSESTNLPPNHIGFLIQMIFERNGKDWVLLEGEVGSLQSWPLKYCRLMPRGLIDICP